MVYAQLFYEFFKTGLFSIGGGLATLPFLSNIADRYPWFDQAMLLDMLAISESTPGPIGVNMATYAGYNAAGFLGGIVASIALVLPSLIIILLVIQFLERFRDSRYVQDAFYGLRPTVAALVGAAGFQVMLASLLVPKENTEAGFFSVVNVKALLLFFLVLFLTNRYKRHPICYLGLAAIAGILFKF